MPQDKRGKGKNVELTGIIRNKNTPRNDPSLGFIPRKRRADVWQVMRTIMSSIMLVDRPTCGHPRSFDRGSDRAGRHPRFSWRFPQGWRTHEANQAGRQPTQVRGSYTRVQINIVRLTFHICAHIHPIHQNREDRHASQTNRVWCCWHWQTSTAVAAACALVDNAIHRAAVDANSFSFANPVVYRNSGFLPSGCMYLDLPGMMSLKSPHAIWVAREKISSTSLSRICSKPGISTKFNLMRMMNP